MTTGLVGSPETRYVVYINDTKGNRLAEAVDYVALEGGVAVGVVNALALTLPDDFDPFLLRKDHLVELWRVPLNGRPYLFCNRLWWMRDFYEGNQRAQDQIKVVCYDQNFLLASPDGQQGRIVAYDEGESQTAKVAAVDDMMKAYVRENMGTLASDTTRDLSTYLSVAGDTGQGPTAFSQGTSRRNLLAVLNELSAMAAGLGTYITWDIVCTRPPNSTLAEPKFKLEFRTYKGQRGVDHRKGAALKPVLIGPDFGNLENWERRTLTANEANYIYARGAGIGTAAAVSPHSDPVRIGVSPFNRREALEDSQAEDADGLADDGEAALRAGRPRDTLTGDLRETDDFEFDVHFGWGDYLTGQVKGQSFDCRLNRVGFKFERDPGEILTVALRIDDE